MLHAGGQDQFARTSIRHIFQSVFFEEFNSRFIALVAIFDGERDTQAMVRWHWCGYRYDRYRLNLHPYYFYCDRAPLDDVLRINLHLWFCQRYVFSYLSWEYTPMLGRNPTIMEPDATSWYTWWYLYGGRTDGGIGNEHATWQDGLWRKFWEVWVVWEDDVLWKIQERAESEICCRMGVYIWAVC